MQILEELIKNPLFGILLTLVAYEIAVMLYNKTKFVLLNPLLVSIIIIIAFLMITGIDYNDYNIGGSIITMFISPITVVLAVPLYLQINVLREHAPVILAGITLGCITAVGSMCAFQYIFNLDTQLFMSLVPKSVTTAIAVEVSSSLGGVPAITVIAVLVAGLFGAIFAPMMGKLFGIKNEIALGLAIGTSSHALGTSKALEIGKTAGAMSSLAIGVAGIITVLVAPLLVRLFMGV